MSGQGEHTSLGGWGRLLWKHFGNLSLMDMQSAFDKEPTHLPTFFLENLPQYIEFVKVIWASFVSYWRNLFFYIHLFIFYFYFWLCWVFVAMRGLPLVAASRGYSSLRCAGFSLQWLLLLRSMGSRSVGFSSCGTRALECRLSSCGARA